MKTIPINHCEQAYLDLLATPKAFRKDPGLSTPSLKKSKRNDFSCDRS